MISFLYLFMYVFDRGVFGDLETTVVHSILDEVIYKLSASSDGDVGG